MNVHAQMWQNLTTCLRTYLRLTLRKEHWFLYSLKMEWKATTKICNVKAIFSATCNATPLQSKLQKKLSMQHLFSPPCNATKYCEASCRKSTCRTIFYSSQCCEACCRVQHVHCNPLFNELSQLWHKRATEAANQN